MRLAHAAGRDPLEFRLEILGDKEIMPGTGERGQPYNVARMRKVLKEVADKAGWGRRRFAKEGKGRASLPFQSSWLHRRSGWVTVSQQGQLKVDRSSSSPISVRKSSISVVLKIRCKVRSSMV